jgi:hypothetical protein
VVFCVRVHVQLWFVGVLLEVPLFAFAGVIEGAKMAWL